MHQSIFTYNLSRPYPFRWFTWLVVIGGIAATAIFSVISVAANGFDTTLITVSNPNETEHPSSLQWYQKRPWSFAAKVSPRCQDQVFTVASSVYTREMGYYYQLRYINKADDPKVMPRASLAYHHSAFENCHVESIIIFAWPPADFNVSILTICTVDDISLPVEVQLWTSYDSTSANPTSLNTQYAYMDSPSYPSWYKLGNLLVVMSQVLCFNKLIVLSRGSPFIGQVVYFFPRPTVENPVRRVVSSAQARFRNSSIVAQIGKTPMSDFPAWVRPDPQLARYSNVSLSTWSESLGSDALALFSDFCETPTVYSRPWNISSPAVSLGLQVDNMIRMLYSAVMSDLGQTSPQNLLRSPGVIFNYTDAVNTMNKEMGFNGYVPMLANYWGKSPSFNFTETTRQNVSSLYAWLNLTAPSIQPSFLNTLYLCQVPKMKPVLSLIFTVIIADLVFLQALWFALGVVIKFVLDRQDDAADYCAGCAEELQQQGVRNSKLSPATTPASSFQEIPSLASPGSNMAEVHTAIKRRPVGSSYQLDKNTLQESINLLSYGSPTP